MLNRPVGGALGARIAEHFVEVLLAPAYDDAALAALRPKKALRILADRERRAETPGERDYKRVLGGLLVQERDADIEDRETMEVVCGELDRGAVGRPAVRLARLQARRVERDRARRATCRRSGSAPGQMSRVDAVRIAIEKAREHGHDVAGSSLASDAFFPFADGPQLALDAGVAAIVQPGGSTPRRRGRRRRSTRPAPRWSSPAAGTSATERPSRMRSLE